MRFRKGVDGTALEGVLASPLGHRIVGRDSESGGEVSRGERPKRGFGLKRLHLEAAPARS